MARLALNRDFSRFLEDEEFPHRVEVIFGDKSVICSGMVLAQQSSIIEGLIRDDCGVLMFEKMENIGTVEQKVECIKYMYGAPLAFSHQNIDVILKFASLYGITDLFHKAIQWIEKNLTARNLFAMSNISESLENQSHLLKLKKVIENFIIKNTDAVGAELAEKITHGDEIDSKLFVHIVAQNPNNGATLLKDWTSKSSENKLYVLDTVKDLDFVTLFPTQGEFSGFVAQLSEGSDSVDVMKKVLALQQEYFVKSASKSQAQSQPAAVASEQEEQVEDTEENEEDDDGEEGEGEDDTSSIASSAKTGDGKPKSRQRGKNRKKRDKAEVWKATNESSKGPKVCNPNQPKKNTQPKNAQPPKNLNQPKNVHQPKNANMPKNVQQPKAVKQQKDVNPKCGNVAKRKVFVANIPSNATANDVKSPFMFCGTIVNVDVHSHKNIAFIEFNNEKSAATVLNAAKSGVKFTVSGQTVAVYEYTPGKASKPSAVQSSVV